MNGLAQVAMAALVVVHFLAAFVGVIAMGLGEPSSPMYAPRISDSTISSVIWICVGTCLASGLLGMLAARLESRP